MDPRKEVIDTKIVNRLGDLLRRTFDRLSFSSLEMMSEIRDIRGMIFSPTSTEDMRSLITKPRFPLIDFIETFSYFLKANLYRRVGISELPDRKPEIVIVEPFSTTRRTRAAAENWLSAAVASVLCHRLGSGLLKFNQRIAKGMVLISAEEVGALIAKSMRLHRCLKLDTQMLFFLLCWLTICLREMVDNPNRTYMAEQSNAT